MDLNSYNKIRNKEDLNRITRENYYKYEELISDLNCIVKVHPLAMIIEHFITNKFERWPFYLEDFLCYFNISKNIRRILNCKDIHEIRLKEWEYDYPRCIETKKEIGDRLPDIYKQYIADLLRPICSSCS